jgi:hypothetical protein
VVVLVAFAAGCGGGGSEPSEQLDEAPIPPLSPATARELVPRTERLGLAVIGNQCEAVAAARELRQALVQEINRGRVPSRLQEPLLGSANALLDTLQCSSRKAPNRVVQAVAELDETISTAAAAGMRRARRPTDFRIPRGSLPPQLDANTAQAAVGLLFVTLDGATDPRLRDATAGQRAIYALASVDGEIQNGGVAALFYNSTGALVPEAIRGAQTIGAFPYREVLLELASLFPGGRVPLARPAREEVLERVTEGTLERLDERWSGLYERSPLDRKYAPYIARHPDQFFRDGEAG